MAFRQVVKKILPPIVSDTIRSVRKAKAYRRYLSKEGIPYSTGYFIYRKKLIMDSLKNRKLLACFRQGEFLPQGYGIGIDERCVEYPWFIGQLDERPEILLDAGSALNYDFLLDLPILQLKEIHILTLAPEEECFWQKKVSYLFQDLRNIPIRDNYYDTISCISTLHHIGCDNSNFTGKDSDCENRPDDFVVAIKELGRVLKYGGALSITVPFGVYCHLGIQQQFDTKMLSKAVEALAEFGEVTERFYLYSANGWNVATKADCVGCHYVEWTVNIWLHGELPKPIPKEPDLAVSARAVACIRMIKKAGR